VEEHEAPPIETTSDEQTSPISLPEAYELHQEDSIDFDGNSQFVSYNSTSYEAIESSSMVLEPSNVQNFHQFKYEKDHICSACKRGKSKKASHPPKLVSSDNSKLEILHMDLCDTMRVASINGKKYILVIVDDYSRHTWVYFLHLKDETPEIIKKFIAQAQLNYKAKVCKIRTDNGTEFRNVTLNAHYEKLGIM
nr:retrotransposon protein, putative, Ty1-copia subclass [Tanacetum cinerariifolium]